ncbi:MAG: phosphate-starvation-inducible PsiE family protein [Geitlerinemataceae cyanobacterium]
MVVLFACRVDCQDLHKFKDRLRIVLSDRGFLRLIESVEVIVAKVLTLLIIVVVFALTWDVVRSISSTLFGEVTLWFVPAEMSDSGQGGLQTRLFEAFGLVLTVLLALEIAENITGYLRKHEFQLELVLVTSLVAISRKIIIFNIKEPNASNDLIGLSVAILSLALSYGLVKILGDKRR